MHTEAGVAMGTRPYMSAGQARYATSDCVPAPADSLREQQERRLVTLTFAGWNLIVRFLYQLKRLRRA
jgi:hypothetical protein